MPIIIMFVHMSSIVHNIMLIIMPIVLPFIITHDFVWLLYDVVLCCVIVNCCMVVCGSGVFHVIL